MSMNMSIKRRKPKKIVRQNSLPTISAQPLLAKEMSASPVGKIKSSPSMHQSWSSLPGKSKSGVFQYDNLPQQSTSVENSSSNESQSEQDDMNETLRKASKVSQQIQDESELHSVSYGSSTGKIFMKKLKRSNSRIDLLLENVEKAGEVVSVACQRWTLAIEDVIEEIRSKVRDVGSP